MEMRQQYIKPSVLRLQYVEDVAVCNTGNCKSNSASQGQCIGSGQSTCVTPSACNTFGS
jgi:hypothetical protein